MTLWQRLMGYGFHLEAHMWRYFSLVLLFAALSLGAAQETLTIWSTLSQPERVAIMEELAERFEAQNPGVTVEVVTMPWSGTLDKLVAAVLAGNPPDISVAGQGWPQTLAGTEGIVPLDDVVADIGGEEAFLGTSLSVLSSLNGTTYGVPIYVTPTGVFYRESWLEAAGYSDFPQTWGEFEEMAAAISDPSAGQFGYTVPFDVHGGKAVWGWLLANGVTLLNQNEAGEWQLDLEGAEETYTYLADLLSKAAPPGAVSYSLNDLQALFTAGRMGLYYESPRILDTVQEENPDILEDIGFAPLPPNERFGSSQGYVSLVVYDTPRSELAKDFLRFFFEGDNLLDFTLAFPTSHFPAYRSVLEDPRYVEGLPEFLRPVAEQAETILEGSAGVALEVASHPWAGEIESQEILQGALSRMLVDNVSAEEAVAGLRQSLVDITGLTP